jgi:hypothetical protein
MRHWLFGGRTELPNLVLLCDVDHGLVHDHDLVLSRQNGRLIVLTPDGRHIWGTADAAFAIGLPGAENRLNAELAEGAEPFVGVHPVDTVAGRRPTAEAPREQGVEVVPAAGRLLRRRRPSPPRRPAPHRPGARRTTAPEGDAGRARRPANRRPGRPATVGATSSAGPAREGARLSRVLFPDGEPTLAESLQERYDRMDLRFAVGVLMGNRDLARRLAAEAGVPVSG